MKTRVLLIFILTLAVCSNLTAANLLNKPESVAYDTLNNRYLVSNAGDGLVVAISEDGQQSSAFTVPGGSGLGNTLMDNVLYVSAWPATKIYSFDITVDTLLRAYNVTGVTAVDGLTADSSGYIYVIGTYTGGSNLIQIDPVSGVETTVVAGLPAGGQDLIFDKATNRIFSVYYIPNSPIIAINLSDFSTETVVTATSGRLDGITIDGDGNLYYCASENDNIFKIGGDYSGTPEFVATVGLWPAGIDFHIEKDLIAVPLFDSNDFQKIYLNYISEVDTTYGQVPLDVNFSGTSSYEVASWHWDFGDGNSSSEQNPAHTYTTAGMFDATMRIITTADDTLSRTIYNISALADTLKSDTTYGEANQQSEFIIYAKNTVPISSLTIPIEYTGNLLLKFDSISTVGCRTDYFEVTTFSHFDTFNKRITCLLRTSNGGSLPDLSVGDGAVLKVYFTLHNTAKPGRTNPIQLDGYSTTHVDYLPKFESTSFEYEPDIISSIIMVPEPLCCQGDRGNVNMDELDQFDISDVVLMVDYMFNEGDEPTCPEETDLVTDGSIDISDLVFMVDYMFNEGDAPPSCT